MAAEAGSKATPGVEEPLSVPKLVSYLRDCVPFLLGGSEGEFSTLVSEEETQKLLAKYVGS